MNNSLPDEPAPKKDAQEPLNEPALVGLSTVSASAALRRLEELEREALRQRCLTLGTLVANVALAKSGLAEEGLDTAALLRSTNSLIRQLGLATELGLRHYLPDVDDQEFAEIQRLTALIKEAMNSRKLTYRKVAVMSGYSISTVSDIVHGNATLNAVKGVAKALDVGG